MSYAAYVFDAYGTLFDVHSAVARHNALVGDNAARLSQIWRSKQLEYSWTRTAMGRYRDFETLTEEALEFAFKAVPGTNPQAKATLMEAYQSLDCYKEVPEILRELKKRGHKLAILSNGTAAMLQSAARTAGIDVWLDDIFSVDIVGKYKTMPDCYAIVTNAYRIAANRISFQSSNRWDIAGAAAFGFDCHWINRTSQPDEYSDLPPVAQLHDLTELL
jgi:2-haloacid dehalogenase